MKLGNRLLWLVLVAFAMLGWAGCGGGCPTTSLGSSSSAGGGSTGGTSTGGTVCGPGTNPGGGGNNASLLYYLDSGNSRILGCRPEHDRGFHCPDYVHSADASERRGQ